jgi:sugar/nucleoside kinase (ribokinase family)
VTITVIGHLCLDEIRHADGRTTSSYGGIYFAVATLAEILLPGDTVRPVFGVGKDEYQEFITHLGRWPNVDPSGIFRTPGRTNSVSLEYGHGSGDGRIEVSRDIADPIPYKKIQSALDADLVMVNMISGFDMTIDTLDEIRMKTRDLNVPVFFDVHSLTLGVREDFRRFRMPVEIWRRWLFMLHTVQMNAEEAAALSPEKYGESDLVKQALALNTHALLLTRGASGATLFVNEKKHVIRHDIEGVAVNDSVDPTGCGDVFGAAYCAHLVHSGDVTAAAEYANIVAAAKSEIAGSSELGKLSLLRLDRAGLREKGK